MREIRSSGSVEGVVSNHDPYSDLVVTWNLALSPLRACLQGPPLSVLMDAQRDRSVSNKSRKQSHRTLTRGSTDIPGRNACLGSWFGLKRIRTGSLCTTLTKLPLAFSGGRRLNSVPAAPGRFSTVPR